jgi:hypothetical protein
MTALEAINDSKRLTIIPVDSTVYLDQGVYLDLDLSSCGIPEDVHALQYKPHLGFGWIEFVDPENPFTDVKKSNEQLIEVPQWAINCVNVWLNAYNSDPANSPE